MLRHDWWWPANREMSLEALVNATSGWLPAGIGAPAPYPGSYLVGTAVAILSLIAGGIPALVMFAFAIALTCTLGARALGAGLDADSVMIFAMQLFALCNPWVYNETVAGHLYMVLSYGASMLLLGEMLRSRPRTPRLVLLPVLILPQLQFFVIALAALCVFAALRRKYVPLLCAMILALPVWVGLGFERSALLRTPYTAAWETSQSVSLPSAAVLSGYFAGYADHFGVLQIDAIWVIVACALIAVPFAARRAVAFWSMIVAVAGVLAASGSRGPLGAWYTSVVLHIPQSGLFRELYDVLGFVAIADVTLLASHGRRAIGVLALVASTIMASAWIIHPVSAYWVSRSVLPPVLVHATPNTRFALMPSFQPMQFQGNGSGADPDAYIRAGNVTPLNEYFARYPVNAALSWYAIAGDVRPLEALSVSSIVRRPWLDTNFESLRQQMNGTPPSARGVRVPPQLRALPEVTLGMLPQVTSLANAPGAGNVFFGDARSMGSGLAPASWKTLPAFVPVVISNRFVSETQGWVDAQFDFAAYPQFAQGLGGAVTTDSASLLRVLPGLPVLADVNGALIAGDRIVSRTTRGYAWVRLAPRETVLRCTGRCVVVGQADLEAIPPLNAPSRSYRSADFTVLTPWLIRVTIPADNPPVLRYNTAYDENWIAITPGRRNVHLRLDVSVNGWILEKGSASASVYLLEWVAALQALCEIVALLWIVVTTVRYLKSDTAGAL